MPISLLTVSDLSVAYECAPASCALRGVNLGMEPGESVGVIGASGSGKTTLARALLALLPPRAVLSGSIRFRGRDLRAASGRELSAIRGAGIALIAQHPAAALDPFATMDAQVAEVARAHGRNGRDEAARAARDALALTLGEAAARVGSSYAHELSGGEQQRVCLAQALVARPSLVVADEPTASLDAVAQKGILDLFARLRRDSSTSFLFITHNPAILAGLVDRLVVLHEGCVVDDRPMREVLRRPGHPQSARLIDAARAPSAPSRRATAGDAAVLDARCVSKTYVRDAGLWLRPRRVFALDNVEFHLAEGRSTAIVGASGTGKSTLARCLAGLERPTRGSVLFRGAALDPRRRDPRAVQLVPQDAAGSLNRRFTAVEAVAEPLSIASRFGARRRREALDLMEAVGIPVAAAARPTGRFSGGQRQRLAIARALAARPEVVIWDESFSALDLPLQSEILAMLQARRRELSPSYIFIAHDLTLAARVCDDIAVMAAGRIVERRPVAEILASPRHPGTRALVEAIPRLPAGLEAAP